MSTSSCPQCEGERACGGYHVYVVELSEEVAGQGPFATMRPDPVRGGGYYYVGSTRHAPACRLAQHQAFARGESGFECGCFGDGEPVWRVFVGQGEAGAPGGTRGNRWAGEFGIGLVWRRYRAWNPLPDRAAAEAKEREIAQDLRDAGHAAYSA